MIIRSRSPSRSAARSVSGLASRSPSRCGSPVNKLRSTIRHKNPPVKPKSSLKQNQICIPCNEPVAQNRPKKPRGKQSKSPSKKSQSTVRSKSVKKLTRPKPKGHVQKPSKNLNSFRLPETIAAIEALISDLARNTKCSTKSPSMTKQKKISMKTRKISVKKTGRKMKQVSRKNPSKKSPRQNNCGC